MATFYQKINLFRGLMSGDTAYVGPFHVNIDITRNCNLHCPGCRCHSPYINIPSPGDQTIKDVSFDLVKRLCEELKRMGTNSICLMGEGEPFLHPRLFDIIFAVKESGCKVTLLTNGTLLDETTPYSLINSGLDILRVSLWVTSREEYEQNHPQSNPDNFKRIIDGLKFMSQFKMKQKTKSPSLILHYPINRFNFKRIEALTDLAITTGCDGVSFSAFVTRWDKLSSFTLSFEEEKFVSLSLKKVKKRLDSVSLYHNIDEILLRYKIGKAVWKKLPCYVAWFSAQIKVDGTVLPCCRCDLPMGNLNKASLHEIWNGDAYVTFRKKAITRKGLLALGEFCDCGFCSAVNDNMRIHKWFKWIKPFSGSLGIVIPNPVL